MIEGSLFLAVGMVPGLDGLSQSILQQHPEVISGSQLAGLVSIIKILQQFATLLGMACFSAGWGVSAGRPWGRRVALIVSAVNVALLPLFTPLGIAGLRVFMKEKAPGAEDADRGTAKTGRRPEMASHVLTMMASLALVGHLWGWIKQIAASQGLPVDANERLSVLWILGCQAAFLLVHETGHLLAAYLVGFRFHQINIGPFSLTQRPGGSWGFRFVWQQVLMSGGYLHAIPQTTQDLKVNWIMVVAAGPTVSLFIGMLGFLALVSLPGGPYAEYWTVAATVTGVCVADCIANMLPLGMTDGAIFVHTVAGTKRGEGILAGLEAAMLNDRADQAEGLIDPVELIRTRKQALEQTEKVAAVTSLDTATQRIEYARATLRVGNGREAAAALTEAYKALEALPEVPDLVWFQYWTNVFETASSQGSLAHANDARQKALEYGTKLATEKMDWELRVPVQVDCARLSMSEGDYFKAIGVVQETRAACPENRALTPHAVELLAVEAECEVRLGRRLPAEQLVQAAIDVAKGLKEKQRARAMELLAHTAVRLNAAGDSEFAQQMFAVAVEGVESGAAKAVGAGYRAAWAESLYENGKLAEAEAVLATMPEEALGFSADVETLRAQLLMAADRPQDAITVLNPIVDGPGPEPEEQGRQIAIARSRALRSWALFRSGAVEQALADAHAACDVLMPEEHPDAAPALLTLAMSVEGANSDLSEAYIQEGTRLICDSNSFSPTNKASRLTDLARSVVQVNRRDWAKAYMEQASKFRGEQRRAHVSAATGPVGSAK
jgi:tetratricopeptide (TPR) repeat protein